MEISIKDILARNPMPGLREAHIRHEIAKAITELTGVEVLPRQVEHIEDGVRLNVPPVLKSALLLRFSELHELLAKQDISITEIR